ncbi:MAG TPA: HAD-IC family P-type ATPase, partial [Actinomycetota bacterium]
LGGSPRPFSELDPTLSGPVAEVAALCNDASLAPPVGDPLEIALLEGVGLERAATLRRAHPRLDARPFDADTRRMCTLHVDGPGAVLLVKGAPEAVLLLCTDVIRADGARVPLGRGERQAILRSATAMAERGMRVLALARRRLPSPPADIDAAERDLTLVGLAGMRDPLRSEAVDAVADTRSAGIRLVMVTGDHPGTAAAIAEEAGLLRPGERVVEGAELESGDSDLLEAPVFARVDPQQKLELVRALQAQGQVVAVTGDGVNDAPALRQADIGVAMGRSGSDVARESADMVITDDNLATIVTAVREGRAIYDNIRKVVDYLVAGNLSEITVVIGTLILFPAIGVPLLPLQLLWINLLTDGLPAIALGLDRADPNLMARAPRSPSDRLLGGRRLGLLSGRAALIAGSSIGSLAVERFVWHEPWAHARAEMFTVLVVGHLLYAWVARRPTTGLLSNPWLIAAVAGGIGLQLLVVAWPAAHGLFATAHLPPREWLLVGVGGALPVLLRAGAGRAYGAVAAVWRSASQRR